MQVEIDLPDDTYSRVAALARRQGRTVPDVVAELVAEAVGQLGPIEFAVHPVTGFPQLQSRCTERTLTTAEVADLIAEE